MPRFVFLKRAKIAGKDKGNKTHEVGEPIELSKEERAALPAGTVGTAKEAEAVRSGEPDTLL